MAEEGLGFRYELTKEIVGILKRLFDARNVKRARVFERKISPIMERMRASHEDFIAILSELGSTCDRAAQLSESGRNDTAEEYEKIKSRLKELGDRRELRRIDRRDIFEESGWRIESIEQNSKLDKLVLTEDEASLMKSFYKSVRQYFADESHEYRHEIRIFLAAAERAIFNLSERGDETKFQLRIKETAARTREYEKRLEGTWAELSRAHSQLKDKLAG
ncbi:hypothetical protein NL532_10165 [Mesorhizobium sp. C120A]|uniref:hypothetical protein n=1 Tax=unclassified Mesorhizobium TaxID=325217 RepID=UPI0003CFBC9F|nr:MULTISPECIES: hypothetical protein [unclassified Mesorhizobium]ESZ66636.1 hypothetical protein X728_04040 [Mesorhizobium sp. L103C120A0]WJI46959.1 hypothetical protein NL532_10165 [Mesorhizobium sp. C120A]